MAIAPQIPFDFFLPEPPRFDNFVVGDNGEAVARLLALDSGVGESDANAVVLWGGRSVGKSHLLAAVGTGPTSAALLLNAASHFPVDPFVCARILCVDDADQLTAEQQAWLFTAFNHVSQSGGVTVASGQTPPGQWAMRDDIRTRMGSGLAFELLPIPQDDLPGALSAYASGRGFDVSDEVLTFLLSHQQRDIASLCQTLAGVDRLSLALKRRVTVHLLRTYLNETVATGQT
ncbi:MAG: DnaA/Hda family protein [Casimicrobium sp.]